MGDVIFVAIMIAFFALAAVFVTACDKIIGEDTQVMSADQTESVEPERAAA